MDPGPSNQPNDHIMGVEMEVIPTQHDASLSAASQSPSSGGNVVTSPVASPHMPKHTVGYAYSAEMLSHFQSVRSDGEEGHPECPDRIQKILQLLISNSLTDRMKRVPIRQVERHEALLVHSEDHWDKVIALQHLTDQQLIDSKMFYDQLSLYVTQGTTVAARLSCGGVIECCLAVARGELLRSFAVVRPPGHHAEPDEHMGFCFFNNVAVAARVVQEMTPLKKILILDWDVHHGNGTQRAFNDNPDVLYMSLHRYEEGAFYPCGPFGALDSCGDGAGLGYSVNVPWPTEGMTDADYIYAFQKVIMPIAMEFAPELVIISAGFDAARGDDIGECDVTPAGYGHMTHMLCGLANGRCAVALEGGYNLESLSKSAVAVTRVLLGEPPEELTRMVAGEAATETVYAVALEQSKYWKSIDVKACAPRDEFEPLAFSIPEILKAHRQQFLVDNYDLMEVPLFDSLNPSFSTQVMCTQNLWDAKTLIVFVHEFGNLQAELANTSSCELSLERSYLIDFSRELISWVVEEGYALLDVNMYPKPLYQSSLRNPKKDQGGELAVYLWDNFVQIASASNIFLVGHGSGCQHVMTLLDRRSASIVENVRRVFQVIAREDIPAVPKRNSDLRAWYKDNSRVFLPSNHEGIEDYRPYKHGKLSPIHEIKPITLMVKALPSIKDEIRDLFHPQPSNGMVLS